MFSKVYFSKYVFYGDDKYHGLVLSEWHQSVYRHWSVCDRDLYHGDDDIWHGSEMLGTVSILCDRNIR